MFSWLLQSGEYPGPKPSGVIDFKPENYETLIGFAIGAFVMLCIFITITMFKSLTKDKTKTEENNEESDE